MGRCLKQQNCITRDQCIAKFFVFQEVLPKDEMGRQQWAALQASKDSVVGHLNERMSPGQYFSKLKIPDHMAPSGSQSRKTSMKVHSKF